MEKRQLVNGIIDIWKEESAVRPLRAEGRSMYPLIKEGDYVYVKFCGPGDVRAGDIIALRSGENIILHRVLEKYPSGFLEKGDFQIEARRIDNSAVVGRALYKGDKKRRVSFTITGINTLLAVAGTLVYRLRKVRLAARLMLALPFVINIAAQKTPKMPGSPCR